MSEPISQTSGTHWMRLRNARLTTVMATCALALMACQPAAPAAPTTAPAKPTEATKPAASPAVPAASPVIAVPSPAASPVASPAASPTGGMPTITIGAADYSFTAPDQIAGGLVTVRINNVGQEPHHAQFLRLNEGVTLEQLGAAFQQGPGPGAALRLVSLEGGPAVVGANGSTEVVLNLRPGTYMLACFVEGADNIPHLAKGMLKPMVITAAPATAAAPPQTAGTITMKDFTYDLPAAMAPGRQVYRVVNEGPAQLHETNILKLDAGKTSADVTAFFSNPSPAGPPPFSPAGGMQGLSLNGAGWAVTDLQAGNYAAICYIPDPASGKPHFELGMIKDFTVR